MLLDINNLFLNSINHKYDPKDFLSKIPLDHVVEIHIAGSSYKYNMHIDTHANAISNDVWSLLDYTLPLISPNGVIIERDSNLPDFNDLLKEVDITRSLLKKHNKI